MQIQGLDVDWTALPAPVPVWYAQVTDQQWQTAATSVRSAGGRLVALWASGTMDFANTADTDSNAPSTGEPAVYAAYVVADGMAWLALPLTLQDGRRVYPDLSDVFYAASRMQRAAADLSGVFAAGASDVRPWLNHGAWPSDYYPLQHGGPNMPVPVPAPTALTDYPFVRVQGDGVHEIAVGPVHAGTIEPGHFRFSVVGEKVQRLEERLGYTHKGIEQRMTQLSPLQACRLAGRVSGDSTVAYAWAYCMALESATGILIPPRAAWLRALMLERERVANHLGDLGALGNDAAFAFGLAQFSRLREDWLRGSNMAFGHRLMMDCVVPGGVRSDLDGLQRDELLRLGSHVESEVRTLHHIYESHAGLQDRFLTTGRVTPALAAQLGLTGLAGRASGQPQDLRSDHPCLPYDLLKVRTATHQNGDVAARVLLRFDEIFESLRLIRRMLLELPHGDIQRAITWPAAASRGMGWVEGWRGEIVVAIDLCGSDAPDEPNTPNRPNSILRCHLHDPSWQNWPVLEHAIMDNIVPDFPLINKSFNLSYSGHDL